MLEEMLEHVVHEYLSKSDSISRAANSRAALSSMRRLSKLKQHVRPMTYEQAFDEFCWEEHPDLQIDTVLCAEREKLFDAWAHAMAKARQPLPQQLALYRQSVQTHNL